jgi:hypothetical protein
MDCNANKRKGEVMAYVGKWGCFIHIPKTSGIWVKTVIKTDEDPGKHDGMTHGLPTKWSYDPIWAVVRDPVDYLASVWAHLWRNGWDTYPRSVPWQTFVELIKDYQTEDFDEFVQNVTTHRRGIVSWFFGVHTPPPVVAVRFGEDLYKHLEGLGYAPSTVEPRNTGHNVPDITETHHRLIRQSEREAYAKWKL